MLFDFPRSVKFPASIPEFKVTFFAISMIPHSLSFLSKYLLFFTFLTLVSLLTFVLTERRFGELFFLLRLENPSLRFAENVFLA